MLPSLRAFLTGIIDYAGLFPPAQLPLDQAVRNYLRYRQEGDAWMLGRFICPAARLEELHAFEKELFRSGPPFAVSALGRGGKNPDDFLAGFRADLDAIASFRSRYGARVTVEIIETRLPAGTSADALAADAVKMLASGGRKSHVDEEKQGAGAERDKQGANAPRSPHSVLTPYFETVFGPDWRPTVGAVIAGIAAAPRDPRQMPGFKLRCGGLEAAAFPTPEQVAFAVTACRDAGVPLKCTAGLHHPVRRFDAGVQTQMHGFLNVFGAGVLAQARRLTEDQVRQIVADEKAENFTFEANRFRWKEFQASTEEIVAARQRGVVSFGSCSFDEPREDLRMLGLL